MPRVWASLGSNVDRRNSVRGAVRALRERYGELMVSSVYESPAVGVDAPPFYNLVVGFDSEQRVERIYHEFRALEAAFGRVRGGDKFAPRTLDIDILTYGSQVLQRAEFELPRDEILRYAFVLGPLAEVAAHERHPLEQRSYGDLWRDFDQKSQPLQRVDMDFD
jgi:2-amino-4-hydroxy-6-hydroxymethyldihydropteridine diphosphokinase